MLPVTTAGRTRWTLGTWTWTRAAAPAPPPAPTGSSRWSVGGSGSINAVWPTPWSVHPTTLHRRWEYNSDGLLFISWDGWLGLKFDLFTAFVKMENISKIRLSGQASNMRKLFWFTIKKDPCASYQIQNFSILSILFSVTFSLLSKSFFVNQ